MDIWLLTFEVVLGTLVATSLWAALLGKTRKGWLYWLLLTPWLFWVIGTSAGTAVLSYVWSQWGIAPSYMAHAATLVVLLTVGSLTVVIAGNRRRDGRLAAGSWPALRLFLAWIAVIALQAVTVWRVDAGVRREMDQAREQINRQYAVLLKPVDSNQSNAADLYAAAFAQIKVELAAADAAEEQRFYDELTKLSGAAANATNPRDELGGGVPEPSTKPSELISLGDADSPRIPPLVKSLESAIHKLQEASVRPVCRADQSQEPPDLTRAFPSLKNYRTAALLLRCHSVIEARAQHFDSAIHDVEAMHRMGRHVQQTTVGLVPFLVGVGIDALADETLAEVLPYAKSPVTLPTAAQVPEQMLETEMRTALAGEYAFETRALLDICEGKAVSDASVPISKRGAMAYRILYLHADLTVIGQGRDATMARLGGQPIPAGAEWMARGRRPPGGLLSQILTSSLWGVIDKVHPRKQAQTRAAATAVALTNYRNDTGHYPASLQELVPQYLPSVPADPFGAKPMRYLLNDGQVTIYSVGDDRVDDGGQLERKEDDPYKKTLDVGLVLRKPVTPANPF